MPYGIMTMLTGQQFDGLRDARRLKMANNVRMRMVKTMYEELIGELRTRAEFLNSVRGENEDSVRMVRAADVIEELTGLVQEAERDRDEYRERLDKANDAVEELEKQLDEETEFATALSCYVPQWIPVTERLPEDSQKVLALELPYGESSRYYYSIVYFSANLEKVDEYDFQGKNRSGFYSLDSEWGWCEHCKVVYWMPLPPLPEPPKESES